MIVFFIIVTFCVVLLIVGKTLGQCVDVWTFLPMVTVQIFN